MSEMTAVLHLPKPKFKMVLLTFFVTLVLFMQLPPVDAELVSAQFGANGIAQFIGRLLLSFTGRNMMLVQICALIFVYLLISHKNRYHKIASSVLAVLFSFSMTFGGVLDVTDLPLTELLDGFSQIVKFCAVMVAWWVIGYKIFDLVLNLDGKLFTNTCRYENRLNSILKFTPLILAVAWLPLLIVSYPGLFMGDTASQIDQFFGYESYTSDSVVLLSSDVMLNQHHPVAHTVLMGAFMNLGNAVFGSYAIGLFLYTVLQWLFSIFTISFAMRYLAKCGINAIVRCCILLIVLVLPIFASSSVLLTKDMIFACGVVLMAISIDSLLRNYDEFKIRSLITLTIGSLIVAFFRNGMIVAVIASIAATIIVCIRKKSKVNTVALSTIGVVILALSVVTSSFVYPALKITPGSQREMLSIPIQGCAAVIKTHENELTEADISAISAVLDYDEISDNYEAEYADPVKNHWNKYATHDDISRFIQTYISLFVRYPSTCIGAIMRNYYGFLYPSTRDLWQYTTENSDNQISNSQMETRFGISCDHNGIIGSMRMIFDGYQRSVENMPLMSLLMTAAFWDWLLIVSLSKAIFKHAPIAAALLIPLIILLITLIGPANGAMYIRYSIPLMCVMIFAAPLVFCDISSKRKCHS